jgi:hypothetical protein
MSTMRLIVALKRLDFSAGLLESSSCGCSGCLGLMLALGVELADDSELSRYSVSLLLIVLLIVPEAFLNNWSVRALVHQQCLVSVENRTNSVPMSLNSMTALLNALNVLLRGSWSFVECKGTFILLCRVLSRN